MTGVQTCALPIFGAKAVANAEPDGYTLLFGNVSTLAVIPAVTKNRDYDPAKNFVIIMKDGKIYKNTLTK